MVNNKLQFQGTAPIELLTQQGSSNYSGWQSGGKSGDVVKEYDKSIRGFCYKFADRSGGRLSLPASPSERLNLIHPILVFQVRIPAGASLTLEVGIVDTGKTRRRLIFSSNLTSTSLKSNPLHSSVSLLNSHNPLSEKTVFDQWMNLVLDIGAFVQCSFHNQSLRLIDTLSIHGSHNTCIRKVFSLNSLDIANILASQMDSRRNIDILPRSLNFPTGSQYTTVYFNGEVRQPTLPAKSIKPMPPKPIRKKPVIPASRAETETPAADKSETPAAIAVNEEFEENEKPTPSKIPRWKHQEENNSVTRTHSTPTSPVPETVQDVSKERVIEETAHQELEQIVDLGAPQLPGFIGLYDDEDDEENDEACVESSLRETVAALVADYESPLKDRLVNKSLQPQKPTPIVQEAEENDNDTPITPEESILPLPSSVQMNAQTEDEADELQKLLKGGESLVQSATELLNSLRTQVEEDEDV